METPATIKKKVFLGRENDHYWLSRTECPNSRVGRTSSKESLRQLLPTPRLYRKDWTLQRPDEAFGNSPMDSASVGGLYSTPNVQSFWSFE
ncbi:hypothetical protein MTR67_038610 [Solanum verrucosum]|uniref:Uncharacterized protein n=1 Tax=Solanum verrucosum TaxID=315347 RepID=A0AAF0UGA6_SOLVR|nr:hypothetical protein MTR67_038610 [Solanum verrucosum]